MLIKAIKKLFNIIYANLDHEGYARFIGVKMGQNVHIYGNPLLMFSTEPWCIKLGDNVHITRDVLFVTHDGGTLLFRDRYPSLEITAPIIIDSNVFIGVRSIIMPGITIGKNCIIAAGSIVTKNIPENSVAAGVPARVIKSTDEYLKGILVRSLNLGHLKGKEKDKELRKLLEGKLI
jgi:acetyltransferase-like isoleucine patch superfamily enzyme